jgi:hypothetical protein
MTRQGVPLVLMIADSLPASIGLPWGLESLTSRPLAVGRLSDDPESAAFDPGATMAARGVAAGLLVFGVDQPIPEATPSRDNVLVFTTMDSLGGTHPRSMPSDITPDLSGFDWASIPERARATAFIYGKYLPDLMVLRFGTHSPDTVLEAAGIWFSAAESLGCCVAIVSTPRLPEYRGWFAIAGPGVRSSRPRGTTPAGLITTLSILSGLPWELSVLEGTPAAGALDSDPWSGGSGR